MPEEDRLRLADVLREELIQLGWFSSQFSLTVSDGPDPDRILVTLDTPNESYSLIRLREEPAYQLAFRLNTLAARDGSRPDLTAALRERFAQLGWPTSPFSLTAFDTHGHALVTLSIQNDISYSLVMIPEETAVQLANRFWTLANEFTTPSLEPDFNAFSSNVAAALRAHGHEALYVNTRRTEGHIYVTVSWSPYGCDLAVEESLFRDPNGPIRVAARIIAFRNNTPSRETTQEDKLAANALAERPKEELPKTALERILIDKDPF